MIVRTAKKQNRFSVVDNTGFNDPRLSYKAKGLLGYFLTKPDNWEVHTEDLRKHGTDGKDSIQAGMRELSLYGYAKLESVRGEGGKIVGKQWVIHEVPDSPIAGKSGSRLQPTDGKTDGRKNRLSGKPSDGKSGYIVNTESLVNTDVLVNTERSSIDDAARAEKQRDVEKEKEKGKKAPQVAGAPPAGPTGPTVQPTTFSQSIWSTATTGAFAQALHDYAPETADADAGYYRNRCRDWSAQNPGKLKPDWIAFAAQIINDDRGKNKLVTIQPISHNGTNHNNHSAGSPSESLIDNEDIRRRAAAIADRWKARNPGRYKQ